MYNDGKHGKRFLLYVFLAVCGAFVILAGVGVVVWSASDATQDSAEQLALEAFLYDEFLILPVRVHLLESELQAPLQCQLSESDVDRIIGKVNRIWEQASIYFYVESVVREQAANQFVSAGFSRGVPLQLYPLMRPPESIARDMFHLYCIHEFRPNGATIGGHDVIFFKDSATLRAVDGGIDEPIPRVIAHQLAYALSLSNVAEESGLMADGTTGTLLNEGEIVTARRATEGIEWWKTPADISEAADALIRDGAVEDATTLLETLIAIPRRSPIKDAAQKRLRQIDGAPN